MLIRSLLKQHFGYDNFRPLQEEIISHVLDRNHTLVLMPTGGGKSLCYQLPALALDGLTLVVSPLIALMKDQVDALTENGVPAAFLNSSLSADERLEVETRAERGALKLLYIAPERLSSIQFQAWLSSLNVSLIAIDEAHCISEWGHDFRPEYRNLRLLRRQFPTLPVIALTATATERVRSDIIRELEMPEARVFLSSFNRPNLHYSVLPKYDTFRDLTALLDEHKNESTIIYCFSRKDTETLTESLNQTGRRALAYHAGLDRLVRMQVQDQFIKDEVPIIVATIAFGMGIDKPDVRLVVHMDFPKTIEGYYQETGRAGRDGLSSWCVLFFSHADKRKQDYFIRQIENDEERRMAESKLTQMLSYGDLTGCRRTFLLQYFAEVCSDAPCGNCDNCSQDPVEMEDATEIAQKILSAVLRTGEYFGSAYVADVLRGSARKQILENHHDRLSVYGLLRHLPAQEVRTRIDQLLREGYLEKNRGEYPTLFVSSKGRQVLRDQESVSLPRIASQTKTSSKSGQTADFDTALFEELRALRKRLADEQSVPPFVIFGNRTLQEMAHRIPLSLRSIGTVFGVGERKLQQYGEVFLECIRAYAQAHSLEEKSFDDISRSTRPISGRPTSTHQQTNVLLAQGLSIEDIAQMRSLSPSTIVGHVLKLIESGTDVSIDHLKPSDERWQKIEQAFTVEGTQTLTAVRERLGEDFSYDELRIARLFLSEG